MPGLYVFGLFLTTFLMVIAKRTTSLVSSFRYQSVFLGLATLGIAINEHESSLFVVAGLIFLLKVIGIPYFLQYTMKKIKVRESLGLIINPQLSLLLALTCAYFSWIFSKQLVMSCAKTMDIVQALSFFIIMIGMFLMIFRLTAIAQIVGILVMENGLFLLASAVLGGMPFIVEIAIFFDVFISVVIMGFFVYRINRLFTHIDVNKLSRLKG